MKYMAVKTALVAVGFSVAGVAVACAQAQLPDATSATAAATKEQQEVRSLSKTKWEWLAAKNTEALSGLFAENCVFVHMGGSWGKNQELNVIKSGGIWYKKADVYGTAVNTFGNTAIVLNDIDLVAVVGGKEVVNPFMVTEVYVKENGTWKMGSLTFSHLARPVRSAAATPQPAPQR